MTLQRRYKKRCFQLTMVDIFRFHNDFHISLHLQDHLRFNMESFDGKSLFIKFSWFDYLFLSTRTCMYINFIPGVHEVFELILTSV